MLKAKGSDLCCPLTVPCAGLGKDFTWEPLVKDDLVAAFVTDAGHEDFIKYSRVWRQVRLWLLKTRSNNKPYL